MIRHLFIPLTNNGFTNLQGVIIVFLFSALFHEWIFAISLKLFSLWIFISFLLQIPLSFFVSFLYPQLRKMAVLAIVIIGLSGWELVLLWFCG